MVIRPGSRVEVPFGNRKLIGIILNSKKMSYVIKEVKYKLKNISKVIDDVPILPNEVIKLLEKVNVDKVYAKDNEGETALIWASYNGHIEVVRYLIKTNIKYALNDFSPNLEYDTRGIYFIPLRIDYSNILYIFPKDSNIG